MAVASELRDWQRVSVGAAARDAIALIEEDLKAEQYRVDMAAYQAIRASSLSPEQALSFFHQKLAMYQLLLRLQQQAKQGTTAAQRIEGNG